MTALVIGVGNDLRGDDGAGLAVARQLRAAGVEAREMRGALTALPDLWQGHERIAIVDAARSGAAPGTLHRFDALAAPLPAMFGRASTHAFGVAEAVALARVLGCLPASLVVHGIEGGDFTAGAPLSAEVAAAVPVVARRILMELGDA